MQGSPCIKNRFIFSGKVTSKKCLNQSLYIDMPGILLKSSIKLGSLQISMKFLYFP